MLGDTCDTATGPILATSLGGRRAGIGIGTGIGMMSSVTSGRQHTQSEKKKWVCWVFAPGPSTFIDLRKRSTLRLTRRTCTSASTTASKTAPPTAPPTIAMRCGDATARAGDPRDRPPLGIWVLLLLLLLLPAAEERDRTPAFRVAREQRVPLPRAATCENERGGDGATIACGGAGWKVSGWMEGG